MKIVNLIENTEGCSGCASEHGLSFYIETKHKLLVDTGATDAFVRNAKMLGVDLKAVDTVILSHGHYDHGGGLPAFIKINSKAKIYIRTAALETSIIRDIKVRDILVLHRKFKVIPRSFLWKAI
ncbi:MAG: MBL fold metallo-hydrolase [Frisingicoccus sp.]